MPDGVLATGVAFSLCVGTKPIYAKNIQPQPRSSSDARLTRDPRLGYCRPALKNKKRHLEVFFFLGGFNSLSRGTTQFSVFSEEYTRKRETELVVDWWLVVRKATNAVPLLFYSDSIFFSNHEWPIVVLKEINVFLFSAFMFHLLAVKDGGGGRADLTGCIKKWKGSKIMKYTLYLNINVVHIDIHFYLHSFSSLMKEYISRILHQSGGASIFCLPLLNFPPSATLSYFLECDLKKKKKKHSWCCWLIPP